MVLHSSASTASCLASYLLQSSAVLQAFSTCMNERLRLSPAEWTDWAGLVPPKVKVGIVRQSVVGRIEYKLPCLLGRCCSASAHTSAAPADHVTLPLAPLPHVLLPPHQPSLPSLPSSKPSSYVSSASCLSPSL